MSLAFNRKIKSAVDAVVPPSKDFTIYLSPTGYDDMEVVRVITPAWKSLGKAERIAKVQNAVLPRLDPKERRRIFRFSVLTPGEWEQVQGQLAVAKSRRIGYRTKRNVAAG